MTIEAPPPVVTVSATYGSGGSVVARRVADALGVPFVDRAIPTAVADELGLSLSDSEALDDTGPTGFERFVRALAVVAPVGGADLPDVSDRRFCDATEKVIRRHAGAGAAGGVILGRAGAVVLRERPATLHVRLDGPVDRRVALAMEIERLDRDTAQRRLKDNDTARSAYVRVYYGVDPTDPAQYHLLLDPTALGLDAATDIVVRGARAVTGAVPVSRPSGVAR